MKAVEGRIRLSAGLLLCAPLLGCAPHAVRVDCDKHLEPINMAAGKPATTKSVVPTQSPATPDKASDDSRSRQDAEP
jgi:hypothetical protein